MFDIWAYHEQAILLTQKSKLNGASAANDEQHSAHIDNTKMVKFSYRELLPSPLHRVAPAVREGSRVAATSPVTHHQAPTPELE